MPLNKFKHEWLLIAVRPSSFKMGCAVLAAALAFYFAPPLSFNSDSERPRERLLHRMLSALDNRVMDLMFIWRGKRATTEQVVIVDIDEKSLAALGQWPWPRSVVAQLLHKIDDAGARITGLDIVFAEPDRTSPHRYLLNYAALLRETTDLASSALNHDAILGEAVGDTETVLGYFFIMKDDGIPPGDALPFPEHHLEAEVVKKMVPPKFRQLLAAHRPVLNLSEICAQSCTEGFFNAEPDESATVRRVPLYAEYAGNLYPSLALEMLRRGLSAPAPRVIVGSAATGIVGVEFNGALLPTNEKLQVWVNYRGGMKTFPYVSAADVLDGTIDKEQLRDKFVLVGTSTWGLRDLRAVPFDNSYPGVEIHASIIDNVLAGDLLRYDPLTEQAVVALLIAAGGLLLITGVAYASATVGGIIILALLAMTVLGNYYWFFLNNSVVGVSYVLAVYVAAGLLVSIANYFFEGKEKRFIRGAFAHYVSADVVSQLVKNPKKLSLEGEQKVLTIMFSDIRGFTSISETMTAHELSMFLNEYLTAMTDVVIAERGTVDKFIGDAVMAIFGAPLDDADHARHSVQCALSMMEVLRQLQPEWRKRHLPEIKIGVGLNTGPVSVGNMGSRTRFDYTVIGDDVNLASRLEGLNKAYGTGILVSEATMTSAGPDFYYRYVDRVTVKGKHEPIRIYEPVGSGLPPEAFVEEMQAYDEAISRYCAQDFTGAREMISKLNIEHPHPVYALYLKRIDSYLSEPPPPDWDGVFKHTEK